MVLEHTVDSVPDTSDYIDDTEQDERLRELALRGTDV
jgi:hypothetical protein